MEINREQFVTLCEDYGITPHSSYSGRGMFGKQCIGIEQNRPEDIVKFLYLVVPQIDPRWYENEYQHTNPDYSPEWEDIREDSMGRGQIFYWPGIRAVDPENASSTLI